MGSEEGPAPRAGVTQAGRTGTSLSLDPRRPRWQLGVTGFLCQELRGSWAASSSCGPVGLLSAQGGSLGSMRARAHLSAGAPVAGRASRSRAPRQLSAAPRGGPPALPSLTLLRSQDPGLSRQDSSWGGPSPLSPGPQGPSHLPVSPPTGGSAVMDPPPPEARCPGRSGGSRRTPGQSGKCCVWLQPGRAGAAVAAGGCAPTSRTGRGNPIRCAADGLSERLAGGFAHRPASSREP